MSEDILSLITGAGTSDIETGGQPFLKIIQKGSPQIDETHKKYKEKAIPDCKVGDIYLSSTNQVICKKGAVMDFVPLATKSAYSEFSDGKFVRHHPMTIVSAKNYKKGDGTEKGQYKEFLGKNDLDFTIYVLGIAYLADGSELKCIIPFTSTGLKAARAWNKALATFRYEAHPKALPPIFARSWKITTKAEQNTEGGWFGWNIEPAKTFDLTADAEILKGYLAIHKDAVKLLPSTEAPAALPEHEAPEGDDPY